MAHFTEIAFGLTLKMSHYPRWRDSCAAGGMTVWVIGSGAWLGFSVLGLQDMDIVDLDGIKAS
jgi:hypothetical protein